MTRFRIPIAAMILAAAMPAVAQEIRPGVAVDARGNAVIDPTKNVLDLVQAAIRRQDDLRDAETRRVNELATQKQGFDLEIARILRANVEEKSLLLATQLKEVKADLQVELRSLNQFRWESGGRGAGVGDAFGYIMAAIMAVIAGAALFWKRT